MCSDMIKVLKDSGLYEDIWNRIKQENEKSKRGENFNTFISSGIWRKENYMRNFLAELLRVNGSHGMETFFLESFVQKVLGIEDMSPEELNQAVIGTETQTTFIGKERRIDITIDTKKRFIPIEVKIDAKDQLGQCADYYHEAELRNKPQSSECPTVVYYLAKDESHELSEQSQLGLEEDKRKFIDKIYFKNNNNEGKEDDSKRKDVYSWLTDCLKEEEVKSKTNVCFGLAQFKESIDSWFDPMGLNKFREKIIEFFKKNEQQAQGLTASIENPELIQGDSSEDGKVLSKIKECYDFYRQTLLEDDFFGGIDKKIEENSYIQRTETHKNAGSDYLCKPCKDCKEEGYEVWLTIEPANRERKLYIGYSLNKDGKYFSYQEYKEDIKELLGFDPNPESNPDLDQLKTTSYQYAPSGGWICRCEIEYDYKEIEKLVFNKNELDKKIGECVEVLNALLNRRYGGTDNAHPRKTI